MTTAIRIENVSKLYRLGTVGTGTISHDLNRWWHQIRGKEDPYAKIGQVNDRTKKAASDESRDTSKNNCDSSSLASRNSQLRAGGPDYVWALRDINLEVQQGEILGIIGRNGAGKSTLLKLLSRVTAPTTGSIKTKGRIASLLEVGTGFHPELTGRENIYMNGAILGMRRHEITRQLDEIVEFSGCAKYLHTPVKRYSSGMTVRLGFAVAAHLPCEIMIVDEVLAVGDAEFQKRCMGKLGSVARSGRTVLFVSHNLSAIQSLCQSCFVLAEGQSELRGGPEECIEKYLNHGVDQSSTSASVEHLVRPRWAGDRGVQFTELRVVNSERVSTATRELNFQTSVRCNANVQAFRIGLTVYSQREQPIGSAFTGNLGSLSITEYRTITLSITNPRLAPGKYFCAITITRGDESTQPIPMDALSDVLHFTVASPATDFGYREWNSGWGHLEFDVTTR